MVFFFLRRVFLRGDFFAAVFLLTFLPLFPPVFLLLPISLTCLSGRLFCSLPVFLARWPSAAGSKHSIQGPTILVNQWA